MFDLKNTGQFLSFMYIQFVNSDISVYSQISYKFRNERNKIFEILNETKNLRFLRFSCSLIFFVSRINTLRIELMIIIILALAIETHRSTSLHTDQHNTHISNDINQKLATLQWINKQHFTWIQHKNSIGIISNFMREQ